MQLARLLMFWQSRRCAAVVLCGALGSWSGPVAAQGPAASAAIPVAPPPPPQVRPAQDVALPPSPPPAVLPQPVLGPVRQPWRGSPYFAVSLGPALASFFSRLLFGGSLAIAAGPMLTSTLGLVLQGRAEIGSLDARYLMVSSGRVFVGLMGRLNERATLTGGVAAGLIGYTRNATREIAVTPFVGPEVGAEIDVVSAGPVATAESTRYQPASHLFVPIGLALMFLPMARGNVLDASLRVGLGYRYR
jgi:hypothetical protein